MPVNNSSQLIKIGIADDHSLFRESLSTVIDTWENCKVVIQAVNGKHLMEILSVKPLPDILLIDLSMPEMNGYETIELLKQKYPDIKIIVLSFYKSDEMLWKIIKSGAQGYVSKADELSRLKKAVWEIVFQGYYFSDHTASKFIKQSASSGNTVLKNQFTEKEISFLILLCTDKTYQEIGKEMQITDRQVEYLREELFRRFDVKSRTGLAIKALKKGLIL